MCRSDWHGWMGHDPDIRLLHVPGHEFTGVVSATGRDVRRFRVGNRVTVPFVVGCGHCGECRFGSQQVCEDQFQPGFTHWGSFAEHVAIDRADGNLVALPDPIGFETAASLGCRFATAFWAVVDQGRVRGGEWVAVQEATAGGAHVSLDALGSPTTCFNSVACLRRRGRHVQVGLMLGVHADPPIPMAKVIAHELEILGSHGMQAWRYEAMLDLVLSGLVRPDRLVGDCVEVCGGIARLVGMDADPETGMTIIDRLS